MTDVKPLAELSVTEALQLAATDAPALVARLRLGRDEVTESGRILNGPSLWPTKATPVRVRLFWWRWKVHEEHRPDAVLATGHRLTEAWARHAQDVATARIYSERHTARKAEAEK